jgi:hypothetical protein
MNFVHYKLPSQFHSITAAQSRLRQLDLGFDDKMRKKVTLYNVLAIFCLGSI